MIVHPQGSARTVPTSPESAQNHPGRFEGVAKKFLKKILFVNALERTYQAVSRGQSSRDFVNEALSYLRVKVKVSPYDIQRIPSSGPLIIIANHPFGGIEGMMLAQQVLQVRSDVKILANPILHSIEEMRDLFLYVDPYKRLDAFQNNFRSMLQAIRWLREGKSLIIFPSGEVSHMTWKKLKCEDPPWEDGVVKLLRKTKADVLPAFFFGRNNLFFQFVGLVHPSLRTVFLPREILNKQNKVVKMRFGNLVSGDELRAEESDAQVMKYLRAKTYALRLRNKNRFAKSIYLKSLKQQPLAIHASQAPAIQKEIDQLPDLQKLFKKGPISAYYAVASQIPNMLDEIGRSRERVFRNIGEGTGLPKDLDDYDTYYTHVFLWNEVERELVGAYRLGLSDHILPTRGLPGLYVHSLFKIEPQATAYLTPGIELGRSFLVEKYQRDSLSLMYLWKAIAEFLIKHPHYRYLFGPVSLSAWYSDFSKALTKHFLLKLHPHAELRPWVRPRHALQIAPALMNEFLKPVEPSIKSVEDVSKWVADLDPKSRGLPVLFKHYMKFGAKFVEFNVDPEFNYCLDGLIVVDLLKAPRATLTQFMGEEGLTAFLAKCA